MNWNVCATALAIVAVMILSGCGDSAQTTNPVTATSAAAPSDLEKIKEALLKAGIKNPPAAVFDVDDKNWSVTITPDGVGPNGEPPPGRPIPERVFVSKQDFSVKRVANPNEGRRGQTDAGEGRIVQ